MSFLQFFESVLRFFGSGGGLFFGVVGFLVALGIYKFVKEWLPW